MTGLEFLAAIALIAMQMVAFVCRLDWLSWRTSRPGPVAFHLASLAYLSAALAHVLEGNALGFGWLGLAVTGLWLVESWHTWRSGPPQHVMTGPAPLDEGHPCRPNRSPQ
jgi:hypothetical protein